MTPNPAKGSNSLPADRYDNPLHPKNNPDFHPAGYTPGQSQQREPDSSNNMSQMDGDHSAKTMDAGANAASNATDMTEGLHEDAKQSTSQQGVGEKTTGQGTSMFNAQGGTIGSAFTKDGAIGGIAEKVGGPFASQGAIGKNFNADGAVGGTFQDLAKKNENH
ncbi:hypothetical protein LTR66_015976 [Elasticomyces elasticus]|nr:hypothetical protein LTR66_015976 [Elasticomyces elasticus]